MNWIHPWRRSPLAAYGGLVALLAIVGDGWSGRPGPFAHQLLLLPVALLFVLLLTGLLFGKSETDARAVSRALWLCFAFQAGAVLLFLYASRHFQAFGYRLGSEALWLLASATVLTLAVAASAGKSSVLIFVCGFGAWLLTLTAAILSFPLNYLRSDMLPVIVWAGQNLLRHVSPYATIHVADRLYDFPYLPGMLTAYLPFLALNVDVRTANATYMGASALMIWWGSAPEQRRYSGAAFSLFLLSPFLQYRHDLYLEPHWAALVAAFLLASKGRLHWGALMLGVSMSLYQFSWILFPFLCLFVWRSRGWRHALGTALLAALGAALFVTPELPYLIGRVGRNTVTQWGHLPHAIADPINLSYWATFLILPSHLLWLQAGLMVSIFGYCLLAGRCRTLADTLRWMVVSVTIFVSFNIIVDGYFYLMISFLLLIYLYVDQGWWSAGNRAANIDLSPHRQPTGLQA